MADRSIMVKIRANASDFASEMGKVRTSLDTLVKKSGDASGQANTFMGRLAQSAKHQSAEWTTAGGTIAGVGAAITGVNLIVGKTGISYNSLQQTSRAALTTMLGSSEKVNAQMDKLDAFAKTSPFSKSVFIQAQQQMLAFGIEAEKVVPYLSAINEAVAASGGNNQTVAELAEIMSKISAASKITAEDLNQFGDRGVNAAELIGSQMGKTGAQIREDITAGTLDADVALEALAAGMQDKFAGASANVKNTFEGAVDRVKAAFRDLSASIMSSAVSPEGGGWLVDFTNKIADTIRWIEKLPQPVKDTVGAISGITGAAALAGGGLMVLVPKALETYNAFKSLSETFPRAASGLKNVGKAAGVAAGVMVGLQIVTAVTKHFRDAAPAADDYAAALVRVKGAADQVQTAAALDDLFKGVSGAMVENSNDLLESMQVISQYQHDVIGNFLGVNVAFDDAAERFKNLDAALANASAADAAKGFQYVAETADAAGWSTEKLVEMFPDYAAKLNLVAANAGLAGLSTDEMRDAMAGLDPRLLDAADAADKAGSATDVLASRMSESADAAKAQADAIQGTLDALNEYFGGVMSAERANLALEESFDKATEAAAENGQTLDANTEAGRANSAALLDIVDAANRNAEAMSEAGASTDDVTAATQRARDQFIAAAQQMGLNSSEAVALADKYGLIPDDVATRFSQPGMTGSQEDAQRLREMIAKIPPDKRVNINVVADLQGYYDANRVLNSIDGRRATAYVTIKRQGQAAIATGGRVGDVAQFADGGTPMWRLGQHGRVYGPGTPTSDSVSAQISRDEFVTRAKAAMHYGYDAMYAINSMRVRREDLRAVLRLAEGGTPSRTYVGATPSAYMAAPRSNAAVTQAAGPSITINSTTNYPVAEPASVREKALLDRAAALGWGG